MTTPATEIERALRFLERGFRNIELPPLSDADISDIADALRAEATRTPEAAQDEIVNGVIAAVLVHVVVTDSGAVRLNLTDAQVGVKRALAQVRHPSGERK
jgi:hypothetical protein